MIAPGSVQSSSAVGGLFCCAECRPEVCLLQECANRWRFPPIGGCHGNKPHAPRISAVGRPSSAGAQDVPLRISAEHASHPDRHRLRAPGHHCRAVETSRHRTCAHARRRRVRNALCGDTIFIAQIPQRTWNISRDELRDRRLTASARRTHQRTSRSACRMDGKPLLRRKARAQQFALGRES